MDLCRTKPTEPEAYSRLLKHQRTCDICGHGHYCRAGYKLYVKWHVAQEAMSTNRT